MKIRKTFLEAMEIIKMNPSSEQKQGLLPFNRKKKNEEDESEYSVRGTPQIAEIYKQLKQISDDPEKVEQLRLLSIKRGVDKKVFDQIKQQIEDKNQPFLSKEMKKTRVANLSQLSDDIKKINEEFKKLKTDLTLKNLYKRSLRVIINKFFTIPGTKVPRRYLILPVSYNNTLNSINELNSAENKYEKMFKMLRDQIVVDPEPIDDEIRKYLERYDYQFKDFVAEFYNNICYTKNGAEIKITDELEKIKAMIPNIANKEKALEKAPIDKQEFIKKEIKKLEDFNAEYLSRMISFIKESGTGFGDQSVVIITWVPRLILTQSTGTAWTSCQNLITGGQNASVFTGMQEGVFIAWLVSLNSINDIRKPKARILIKPFFPKDKGNRKDIIWWSSKIYTESGGNLNLFKKVVNSFLYQKQQKTIEIGKGVSKDFALMSNNKNSYIKDKSNRYRIYPDNEQSYDLEKQSFEKLLNVKNKNLENLFNAHDFNVKTYITFLKNLPDKEFDKYMSNTALLSMAMQNNLPTVLNYVTQRIKSYDLKRLDSCYGYRYIEPETSQTIVKIFINFLNELYRIHGDKIFDSVLLPDSHYKAIKDHQFVNQFLKEKVGYEIINKRGSINVLMDISSNKLISADIKKNANLIIKDKIQTENRNNIIKILDLSLKYNNQEIEKLVVERLDKAFDEIDKDLVNDISYLMQSYTDIDLDYSFTKERIKTISPFVLSIIKKVSDKKPNIMTSVNQNTSDLPEEFAQVFIKYNENSDIIKATEIKSLNKAFIFAIKSFIEEGIEESSGSYSNFFFRFKNKEDIEFFMKFNKNTIIAISVYLSDTFNLMLENQIEQDYVKDDLALAKIFFEYIEENPSILTYIKTKARFDETFVQLLFNAWSYTNISHMVKNLTDPTIRKLIMFIINQLSEEKKLEILTNISLFFIREENSPMIWYVDEIKKHIKDLKNIKKFINNFVFEGYQLQTGSFSDYIEMNEQLIMLLPKIIGKKDAIVNIDFFLKTFNLEIIDLIDMLTININNINNVVNLETDFMHYMFKHDQFKEKLETIKVKNQSELDNAIANLTDRTKMSDNQIKRFDYLVFLLNTKKNSSMFKKMVTNFNSNSEPTKTYNFMKIFFPKIKIKEIIYDFDIKFIFSSLEKKEIQKILDDLKITYEKKDIDSILA